MRRPATALPGWRRTPPGDRIQPLFRLKALLDANFTNCAQVITQECGKTIGESEGELKRGLENVEVASRHPVVDDGQQPRRHRVGIDELMIRQPVGIVAAITPFNFPAMIPLWFLPYAVACGNTLILKPSEKTPMTMGRIFELIEAAGFPPGVVNLVHGGKAVGRRADRSSRRSARSRSSDRPRWRDTSTRARLPTASAPSAREAPRTRS